MTDSAADLVKTFTELDDWLTTESKRFEQHIKPVKERMEGIKSQLHEMLLGLGSKDKQSISTDHGTVYTSTIMTPKVSPNGQPYKDGVGRDAFLDFCLDNWEAIGNEMLQLSAPQKDAVKRYMEEHGTPPPGVEVSSFVRVNIRRS